MWKMPRGVVINSGKVVEKEVQNVPAGQFSVKFGIIPKNMVLLRITFSVFVLSCSGEEVFALKPVTKGQGFFFFVFCFCFLFLFFVFCFLFFVFCFFFCFVFLFCFFVLFFCFVFFCFDLNFEF